VAGSRPGLVSLLAFGRGAVAVQVFAADREPHDEVGEVGAVGLDGRVERGEFVGDACFARGAPHAEQEGGVGGDGGRDGRDDVLLGLVLLTERKKKRGWLVTVTYFSCPPGEYLPPWCTAGHW
jgi:hypothetical protein